ncbi:MULTISPECIES: hypothetical protein [unclassified Sphingomonas]|uniref:hypothetical protein n=1 Tax=unclassified Sphingomonas TaxID=196159 RepID=UPI000B291570|nr:MULTISPECIES: hypothetical protein [unclassified Sphingomonas]
MTRGRVVEQTAQASAAPPPIDGERVAAAWKSIRADRSIQFDLPEKVVPPREPAPAWLEAVLRGIGRFVEWVGGGWRVLLYGVLALIVIALVVALVPGVRDWFAAWFGRKDTVEEPGWTPDEGSARALLEDADVLAAAGRYGEAVHLLLFRSIDDIVAWRGDVVRVADTSRDIARADALPAHARGVFAGIVAAVERSLFGGAELGEADWRRAREDYAGFALGRRA